VVSGFGIDQLHIYPKAITGPLYRPFEDIADIQLTTDLLHVDGSTFEGEREVIRDRDGRRDHDRDRDTVIIKKGDRDRDVEHRTIIRERD
jgi:hypothetical protein